MKTLKKYTLFLFLLGTLSSFTFKTSSSYTGKWKGEDKGDIGFLILSDDSYATFEFGENKMGGKSYTHSGIEASMTYEINRNTSPHSIDFIITNNSTKKELGRLKGVLKLIDNNKLNLAMGFGGKPRPKDFSTDAIIFNRVQ